MKKVRSQVLAGCIVLLASGIYGTAAAPYGQCRDPWLTQAIQELIGRDPVGYADIGECNTKLYGGGSWSSYDDLKNKVRESVFNAVPAKKAQRCFGAEGAGCDALQFGIDAFKAGRTNLPNGSYRMWISVGSIKHDNCCIANPNGKMCGGFEPGTSQQLKDAATNMVVNGDGHCVQEWDKAFWNAADGRAWTQDYDPRVAPDLTIVTNPRQTRSQNGTALVPFETAETRRQYAPRGQAVDVGDEAFCASGRATLYNVPLTPKKWLICQ